MQERKKAGSPSRKKATALSEAWLLRLYIAGRTGRSLTAFANLKRICGMYIHGQCTIEVIDLSVTPALAADDQIIAVPALVRILPKPQRTIIGDLSDTDRVLLQLDIRQSGGPHV